MKRLVCFHLFNDFSGSPKVLRMVLGGLAEKGMQIDLITSKGEGALSDLSKWKNVKTSTYAYRFSDNPAVTMARYFGVQIYTFGLALRYAFKKDTTFYVNTILPVGAALAGRLTGKRVVYHYHENAFAKGAFYKLLACAMQALASEIICVSAYQRSFLKREKNVHVVPNATPATFVARLCPNPEEAFERKRVLMLGSLKRYKGTLEFIELAQRLTDYQFELVLNETPENIAAFWKENGISQPANLTGLISKVFHALNLTAINNPASRPLRILRHNIIFHMQIRHFAPPSAASCVQPPVVITGMQDSSMLQAYGLNKSAHKLFFSFPHTHSSHHSERLCLPHF